ncbi:hypothetical protein [Foetidibacter luteolus]|uniref:hypothetical protein n=1 Tax=Foetidibacter luteolus TaxID=2608880 RepID=UPI00129AD0C8|nr:hypothetical protein [Foetidibacter luteolus]
MLLQFFKYYPLKNILKKHLLLFSLVFATAIISSSGRQAFHIFFNPGTNVKNASLANSDKDLKSVTCNPSFISRFIQ